LLPKSEVLEQNSSLRHEEHPNRGPDNGERERHPPKLAEDENVNDIKRDGVFADYETRRPSHATEKLNESRNISAATPPLQKVLKRNWPAAQRLHSLSVPAAAGRAITTNRNWISSEP
jgi:hypothetical protein